MKGLSASNRIKIKCTQEQMLFFNFIYITDLLTKTSKYGLATCCNTQGTIKTAYCYKTQKSHILGYL